MYFEKSDLVSLYDLKKHCDLLKLLVDVHGEPIDSYWNGSHTWFTQEDKCLIEWRIHPVSGFRMPEASRPEELFTMALENEVDPLHYWEGLEVFPVEEHQFDEESFSKYCTERLGTAPDFVGYVDHETVGNDYERNNGNVSIISLLAKQLKESN